MTADLRQGDVRALGATAAALLAFGSAFLIGIVPLIAEGTLHGGLNYLGYAAFGLGAIFAVVLLIRLEPAWSISFGVAAMIFSSNWDVAGSPVPLDRVFIASGLCSLLLRARSTNDILGRRPSGVHLMLVLAAVYALFSAVFNGTIAESGARFALLDAYGIMPFLLFAVAPAVYPEARHRKILLWTLTVVGAYLAYTSILGWLGPHALVFPGYITDPAIGIHADRARGPFIEAGADGLGLFECAVAAVLLALLDANRRVKVFAGAVAVACGLGIILTLTRSVWIASAFALVVTLLVAREARRYFVPAVAGGILFVLAALAIIPGLQSAANDRTNDDSPIWDRKNSNNAAIRMIEESPLIGKGWYTFQNDLGNYVRLGGDYPVTRANLAEHNVFLSNAAQLGLVGASLWFAALAWGIGGGIMRRGPPDLRLWKIGMLAIGAQWFVIANFVPLGYAFPNALIWLWAGILWVPSMSTSPAWVPGAANRRLAYA